MFDCVLLLPVWAIYPRSVFLSLEYFLSTLTKDYKAKPNQNKTKNPPTNIQTKKTPKHYESILEEALNVLHVDVSTFVNDAVSTTLSNNCSCVKLSG